MKRNELGNTFIIGLGYLSDVDFKKSILSFIGALLFTLVPGMIDIEEKRAINYCYIASRIKVSNMIIARILILLINYIVCLAINIIFFGMLNYTDVIPTISLVMLFIYNIFMISGFLLPRKIADQVIGIFGMIGSIYLSVLLPTKIWTVMNVILTLTVLFLLFRFSEEIFRIKLIREVFNDDSITNNNLDFILYSLNIKLEILAEKIYIFLTSKTKYNHWRKASIFYLDCKRNFRQVFSLIWYLLILLFFKNNILLFSITMMTYMASILNFTRKNFQLDKWIYLQGLISKRDFILTKFYISIIFNMFYMLILSIVCFTTFKTFIIQWSVGTIVFSSSVFIWSLSKKSS